jgi:hypothetical protein
MELLIRRSQVRILPGAPGRISGTAHVDDDLDAVADRLDAALTFPPALMARLAAVTHHLRPSCHG